MKIGRSTKWITAWTACLAVVLASLMPFFAHAAQQQRMDGLPALEICSVNGKRLMPQVDGGKIPSDAPVKTGMAMEHCLVCLAPADTCDAPPVHGATQVLPIFAADFPTLYYQSPHPLFAFTTPHSRAPPIRL